jgi:hypothetical protein
LVEHGGEGVETDTEYRIEDEEDYEEEFEEDGNGDENAVERRLRRVLGFAAVLLGRR